MADEFISSRDVRQARQGDWRLFRSSGSYQSSGVRAWQKSGCYPDYQRASTSDLARSRRRAPSGSSSGDQGFNDSLKSAAPIDDLELHTNKSPYDVTKKIFTRIHLLFRLQLNQDTDSRTISH